MPGAYIIYLLTFFAGPTALLWLLFYKQLVKYKSIYMLLIAIGLIGGSLWDSLAIWLNIWIWPEKCCVVPKVGVLPIEEFLFMIITPVYIATVTILMRDLLARGRKVRS